MYGTMEFLAFGLHRISMLMENLAASFLTRKKGWMKGKTEILAYNDCIVTLHEETI